MRSIGQQFKTVTPILLIVWLITLLSLLLGIYASTVKDIPLESFTKDPTALMNAPFYLGFFSNIGIMIWSGAAMINFFVAYQIKDNPKERENFLFILFSAFITLMMTLDDLFQLHEFVFPNYFSISDNAVYLTYMNIFLLYFIYFRKRLLASEFTILGLAFFFLGLSTIIDVLPLPIPKDTFLEDAIKLFGIVTWFIYYFRTGNEVLSEK
ncbi:MAG TPA: hypothetical protein PLG57_00345 [Bacteroidia bacterium]|jgi:hypothetical protein|nr:hypothetical protein [Bacteroidia bacterium]HQF27949.1 hypothetical protein [Bacteroidia bacterium]HQK97828.1 hypothetical protein [Bacteroidia bacterium]